MSQQGIPPIRIVTSQSGRSIRIWKIMSWFTLAMVNMNIAEQKGRGKYRWGFTSLLGGPFVTMFLTFSASYADDPSEIVPRTDAITYSSNPGTQTAVVYQRENEPLPSSTGNVKEDLEKPTIKPVLTSSSVNEKK